MPIRAFRTFAHMLAREPDNQADMRLLRHYAVRGLAWLVLTEFALILGDYPLSLLANVLVHRGPTHYLANLNTTEAIAALAVAALTINLVLGLINLKMSSERNSFEHKLWDVMMKTGSRHLVRLDTAWHNEHGTGEKENMLNKNYTRLWNLIDQLVFGTIPSAIRDILIACGLFVLDWRFGVLALLLIAAYASMVQHNDAELMELSDEYRDEMKAAEEYSSRTTDAVHEVKSLGLGEHRYQQLSRLTGRLYTSELTRHRRWAFVLFRQDVVLSLGVAATMWVAYASYHSGLSIGGVVLGIGWIARVNTNLFRLTDLQYALNRGGPALKELNKFFATEPVIVAPEQPQYPEVLEGGIEFAVQRFAYPGKPSPQINDVSFDIAPGSFAAFVGRTGCGKSTIIRLIQRLYDACAGSIKIDGVDVRELDLQWLRGQALSVVSQDPRLFDGTIYQNIAYGNLDASEDEIVQAAREACVLADDFCEEHGQFPLGLQSLIGENGIRLSGGQKARVALARAIVADSAILLLDEATAALDNKTEYAIQQRLDERSRRNGNGRKPQTVLAIAHRLTTVRRADVILVMKEGRIVETGKHAELIAREGEYYELWQSGSM